MSEIEEFFKEKDLRDKRFKLFIDYFENVNIDYDTKEIFLGEPVKRKQIKLKIVNKKINNKKGLF